MISLNPGIKIKIKIYRFNMNKGIIRIQKGLLMIEALVKSKDLTPEQKLEDIQYCLDKIWDNER